MPPFTQSLSRGYPSFQNWYGQPGGGVENFPEYENFVTFARDLGAFERRWRDSFAQITLGIGEEVEFNWDVPADECWIIHNMMVDSPGAGIFEGDVERIITQTTRVHRFARIGVPVSNPTPLIGYSNFNFAASQQWNQDGPLIALPNDHFLVRSTFEPGTSPVRLNFRYELIPIPVDNLEGVPITALST